MKVYGPGGTPPSQSRPAARRDKSGGASFASNLPGETEKAASTSAASPASSVDALLALQEINPDRGGRKKAVQRGNELLDKLDEIRHGLLMGSIPLDRLEALARLVREQKPQLADPKLAEVLSDIELRVEVELAKLGR